MKKTIALLSLMFVNSSWAEKNLFSKWVNQYTFSELDLRCIDGVVRRTQYDCPASITTKMGLCYFNITILTDDKLYGHYWINKENNKCASKIFNVNGTFFRTFTDGLSFGTTENLVFR